MLRRTGLMNWGRQCYMLASAGISIILNEGWQGFWLKFTRWCRRKISLPQHTSYRLWIARNEPELQELNQQRQQALSFRYRPKISIVTRVWNTDESRLRAAIESVLNQTYDNWELCIAGGNLTQVHVRGILQEYASKDARIKVKSLSENKGIAEDYNEALSFATGEFIGLLDHDDALAPFALYEVVKLLNQRQEADFIYSDEDKITADGRRDAPFFKPDWSPDMFLSCMYACRLGIYRRKIVDEIGGFRAGYDGSQDCDLVLRLIERTDRIYHIPRVLYHRRAPAQSASFSPATNPDSNAAARKALSDYLTRNRIQGEVSDDGVWHGVYRVTRKILGNPSVSIIIPTRDNLHLLKRCITSILEKTIYRNYEIMIVDNRSIRPETLEYLNEMKKHPGVRIIPYDKPFNFSALNNYAVSQANGEHILFLNNDTEIITGEWLSSMLEHSQRKEVGAAGCLLLYPNNRIQHAGIIIGPCIVTGHSHKHRRLSDPGYFHRPHMIHNLSAVTGACMMLRKEVFNEVGGFDENLSIAFNDVDLCLKMREKGYLIVYTPYARLYHHESYSRGYGDTPKKQAHLLKETEYMRARWGQVIDKGDPYYNPNLTLDKEDFSIRL